MTKPESLAPVQPLLIADRFAPLGAELITLLRSLRDDQWHLPTVCAGWSVQDVAAHLLDTACRRLSMGRDAHRPPPPGRPIDEYGALVSFLNDLNAQWVIVMRRLSPRLLTDFMALVEPPFAEFIATLDPWAPGVPVSWAGESQSQSWFDVARELTERWHHQQQIRLAMGAPPLDDPRFSEPVLETFLRALPFRYRDLDAPTGASLAVRVEGRVPYAYTLRREANGWALLKGEDAEPATRIVLAEEPAWLLLTKGMKGDDVRGRATIEGDERLAAPFFGVVAVMA
ncbi:MAG TPA: maleylpyruvate isomerase N-terminal domain-containing protein [Thermoanaerobaculia bacterium]|nr:maleylpyruvate isomerase N-terminal domain-containing protein [Thermoanaerobaculia bacterium]